MSEFLVSSTEKRFQNDLKKRQYKNSHFCNNDTVSALPAADAGQAERKSHGKSTCFFLFSAVCRQVRIRPEDLYGRIRGLMSQFNSKAILTSYQGTLRISKNARDPRAADGIRSVPSCARRFRPQQLYWEKACGFTRGRMPNLPYSAIIASYIGKANDYKESNE